MVEAKGIIHDRIGQDFGEVLVRFRKRAINEG